MHWDQRFLDLAKHIATWSKDPSTKVGAVITRPNRTIVSVGFNGFPRGVDDNPARYEDRSTKYKVTVHAERNAILHAREPLDGTTLYVAPLHPCATCAGEIIQAGIARVVVSQPEVRSTWYDELRLAETMLREANINVEVLT